jgi:predicted DNA-binding transcriptional regulator YafY
MANKMTAMVRLLNAIDKGTMTLDELREDLAEVSMDGQKPSVRTLHRYKDELTNAGFPIYYDRKTDVYRFAEGFSLRKLEVGEKDLSALMAIKSIAASLGPEFSQSAGVLDTILANRTKMAQPASLVVRAGHFEFDGSVQKNLNLIRQAEMSRRQISFQYTDKFQIVTNRTVDPYGVQLQDGRAYLIGFDHLRNSIRSFAVDNIDAGSLQMNPSTFVRPASFDLATHGQKSFSGLADADELTTATVEFTSVVARAAIAASSQHERDIDIRPDGSARVTYRIADQLELIRWTMRYGSQAEVVGPEEARKAAASIALDLVSRYVKHEATLDGDLPVIHVEEIARTRALMVKDIRSASPGLRFTGMLLAVGDDPALGPAGGEQAVAAMEIGRGVLQPIEIPRSRALTLAMDVGQIVTAAGREADWEIAPVEQQQDVEIAR